MPAGLQNSNQIGEAFKTSPEMDRKNVSIYKDVSESKTSREKVKKFKKFIFIVIKGGRRVVLT